MNLSFGLGFCLVVVVDMGCGGSKEDNLPLVIRCRERKELIRAAADHRYALAAAHITYFRSLVGVGDALRQFIDEELLLPSPSASPVLTLPSNEGKTKKRNKSRSTNKDPKMNKTNSSPSISLHSDLGSHIHLSDDDGHDRDYDHDHDHDGDGSHLHLSSSLGSDSEFDSSPGHIHLHDSTHRKDDGSSYSSPPSQTGWRQYAMDPPPEMGWAPYGVYPPSQMGWNSYPINPPAQSDWNGYGTQSTSYAYYMKRSSPQIQSVIYDPTKSSASWQLPETSNSYLNSYATNPYGNGGYYGYPMQSPARGVPNRQPSRPADPPPPPSPKASAWDFLNPFDGYDSGYPGYTYGSIASSADSTEVREREGIPDLEDETESEVYRETYRKKNLNEDRIRKIVEECSSGNVSSRKPGSEVTSSNGAAKKQYSEMSRKQSSEGSPQEVPLRGFSEGTTRGASLQNIGASSKEVPSEINEEACSVNAKEVRSSPDAIMGDGSIRKRGVTFGIEATPIHDVESSRSNSLSTASARGTCDLQEVVAKIRDEFVTASKYGKEVAMLLEVGKLPHQPKFALLKEILSRILYMVAPSSRYSDPPSKRSVRFSCSTMKPAKAYYGESAKNSGVKPGKLLSTLEKLYVWEKKLYKEVKDEEKLRVIYEKKCKRLQILDERGAESSEIDATQASVRKLLTKLDVCIRTVDAISRRIHKLRDEELQPQVSELIDGLVRMWRSMLKCHQKQFQAIIESKTRSLRTNTNSRGGSSLKATLELEMELHTWCEHFSNWITTQKSFVESLNGWLQRCIFYETEETPDGVIPYSPGQIGAPRAFVICNDWFQGMERISETRVAKAMKNFALSLEHLLENQAEEQRQRLKAEYLSKDFEKRLRILRTGRGKIDTSDSGSLVPSDHSGVSAMDDLKVDLDLMKKKWAEERVHSKGSGSIQAGLMPIFEALGKFTSEALKAYEHVRIENTEKYPDGK